MKRLLVVITMVMAMLFVGTAANAATYTSKHCRTVYNATVCTTYTYHDQADGTGFVVTGASSFADVGPRTNFVDIDTYIWKPDGSRPWSRSVRLNDGNGFAKSWSIDSIRIPESAAWHTNLTQNYTLNGFTYNWRDYIDGSF